MRKSVKRIFGLEEKTAEKTPDPAIADSFGFNQPRGDAPALRN